MFGKTKVRHRSIPGAGIFGPSRHPTVRAAAVFLSVCLAFTMMPTPAFAVTPDRAEKTGLCEHHPAHTAECGYQKAKPGHSCIHEYEHTEDCYTDELICGYIEEEDTTASDSDAGHVHTRDCHKLDCPHERGEHNEDCGYTEGEAGAPCRYVCELCGQPDKIAVLCAAIDALPTVEEIYENAPGDVDPEFDVWVSKTSAKLAEVPALWKQFLALSEDEAAMERITEARAEKLAALHNLAERLGEMEPKASPAAPSYYPNEIYANGVPLILAAGTTKGNTVIYIDTDRNGEISDPDTIVSFSVTGVNDNTKAGNNLKNYTIYSGTGKGENYTGDTSLIMLGGQVSAIYGGGNSGNTGGKVTGDTYVTIKGGQVGGVYGGGDLSDGTNVDGSTSIVIDGGTVGEVYGGGNGNGVITGDSAVTITGGTIGVGGTTSMVCGGGNGQVEGTASVNIAGGQINALVFGGGREGAAASSQVTVTGGQITGRLYGGGLLADTTGETSVSITGDGLVKAFDDNYYNGCIYGGNYNNAAGSQSVTLGGSAQAEGGVAFKGSSAQNGVSFVTIESGLTGTNPVSFILPKGFDASEKPVIATGAVEADLAKIKLAGPGSTGLEAYLDGTDIKARLPYNVSVSVKEQGPYYRDDEIFLMADVRDAKDETEMTTGTVQFYKNDVALDSPVSYSATSGFGKQKGFALAVICGSSSFIPELTAGSDNIIKAVYTPVSGTKVTSKPITVSVSDKMNGNEYISSMTVENLTGDGVNYVAPVQFGVANSGGEKGIKASEFVITGEKDNQTFTDFQIDATDNTASVMVREPGTYVFTAKLPESSSYAGTKVSNSVVVLAPYTVTYTLENLTAEGQPIQANYGKSLSATLSPAKGYKLPDAILVYMDDTLLVYGTDYTYDSSTGVAEIACVTGNVSITASGVKSSDAKQITAFTIQHQVGDTVIDQSNHTVTVTMPNGTDVTSLTPTVTVSDKAGVSPASGMEQDFTNSVIYTVTAEDGSAQVYTVTVSVQTPSVTGVTITPETADVQKGSAMQFSATVTGANNPAQTVIWSIEGSHASGTNISNTGLLTVADDEMETTLTVKATSTVDTNKNGTATVNITTAPPSPTYGISLSQSGAYTFAGAAVGYGEQTPLTVTVTNTGNQPTGPLNVQISGEGRDAFALSSPATIASIAPGGTGTFTVKPVTGLPARTYTAAVSVSGSNISTARFDVSFTVSAAQPATYAISGTIRGSDTGSGIAAVLQLKDSQNANVGAPVTAGADGSYTITGIPAGTYQIEVSCAGYDSGIIDGIVVSDGDVTDRDLTLHKTVTFIPVTGITMTSAATVEVNTSLPLTGTVSPDNATNRAMVWSVEEAGGTGAFISGSTFRAVTPGTATVKATVAKGLTASAPYEKTFTITVTAAPAATHTITASAGSGGTISPSGAVAVNEGQNQTFTITTDSRYRISQVTVDGVDKGAVAAYTFEHVTADHSIFVTFRYVGGGSSGGGGGSSSGGGSSPSGSSSSAPSTTTSTTEGENGTSTMTTQTTSKDNSGKTTTVTTEVTKDAAGNATGSATTVTTDNITAQADQGSSTVTVKPDAAAIGGAAKAAGASETNPMDISVAVPQETLRNELQKADVRAVQVEVILPKSVADNPAVGTAGVTVEKETVDAARQSGKNVTVTVREDTGTVKAVWTLDGQAMGNAAGQSTDLNLGVRTAPVQSDDPIAAPVKPPVTAAGQENGLVISLTADGTLLSSAKLTVPATNQTAITAGSAVALYRFDQNTGVLSAIPGGLYLVDENGNVTIDIPAGTRAGAKETYVLLPVPAAPGTTAAGGGGGGGVHTIKAGDTLNQIGRQYGCRVEDLLALNPGVDIYNLQIGSDLRLR